MNQPKVILDVKGLIMHSYFRCADTTSPLIKEDGEKTPRATAAFECFLTSYLLGIFETTAPVDVIACWDSGNSRRRDLFPAYKKKRSEKKEDKVVGEQLDILCKMVKGFLAGMGCIQVSVPHTEADDVVAYISRNLKPYCSIYSVDKDLIQLSNETTLVYFRDEPVKEMTVRRGSDKPEYIVPPKLVTLYKSIVGDPSDEYPGVRGFGHVAWLDMVDLFGLDGMEELDTIAKNQNVAELDAVYADTGDSYLGKLQASKYSWFLMYELARLHPEWCNGTYKGEMVRPRWFKRVPDTKRVRKIIEQAGCLDVWDDLEKYLPVTVLVTADNIDSVIYEGDFMDDLNDSIVSFDYETDDPNKFDNFIEASKGTKYGYVDVLSAKICGVSFTWGANLNKTVYICIDHKGTDNVPVEVVADILTEVDNPVAQNSAFEKAVTENTFGKTFVQEHLYSVIDTVVLSSYVDENTPSNLKMNSKQWLNYTQTTYKEVIGNKSGMKELTGEEVFGYGADDAIVTAHLWSLWDLIMQVEGTAEFCYKNEFLTDHVLHNSYMKGCNVDLKRLKALQDKDRATLDRLHPRLRTLLAENCQEENGEATGAYIEAIKPFVVAKMEEEGKTETQITDKIASITRGFLEGTVYTPYRKEVIPHEFKPTATQLNAALVKLNMPEPIEHPAELRVNDEGETEIVKEAWVENGQFYLKSTAPSRVTEWAQAIHDVADPEDKEDRDILEFVALVAASSHQFKARAGVEYEALKAYMINMFPEKGKTVVKGDELNFDSPKQMAHLLYGKLALPIRLFSKVTAGSTRDRLGFAGGPATDDKAMETALAEDVGGPGDEWRKEVIEIVRDIKTLETKFKFYYTAYPLWVRPDDGRIHPSIKNCGTATRRPTGGSPNILQVQKGPIRSVYHPMEEGHIIIAPDFSGQELRLMASESLDKNMLEVYLGDTGKDLHSVTASAILPNIAKKLYPDLAKDIEYSSDGKTQNYEQYNRWRSGEEGVDKQEFAEWVRSKRAKETMFLNSYANPGGGVGTLSTRILVPEEEAQMMLDGLHNAYPGIDKFKERIARVGKEQGYVRTAYGNVGHATDDLLSKDKGRRMRVERQLVNKVIQSGAADTLKEVIADAERENLWDGLGAYLMAPVYDELVCSVPVEHAVEFCQRLQKLMDVTPPGHKVPMVSEFSIGFDWFNLVEVGVDTSEGRVLSAIKEAEEIQVKFEEELF